MSRFLAHTLRTGKTVRNSRQVLKLYVPLLDLYQRSLRTQPFHFVAEAALADTTICCSSPVAMD